MATPRKSAQQLAAREKARAKARELTERHEKLIDLATEFFQLQERADQIRADAQAKAKAILAQAEEEAARTVTDAAAKVREMLATGESKASVAARLDLSNAELKRSIDLPHGGDRKPSAAPSAAETAPEAPAGLESIEHAA